MFFYNNFKGFWWVRLTQVGGSREKLNNFEIKSKLEIYQILRIRRNLIFCSCKWGITSKIDLITANALPASFLYPPVAPPPAQ